MKIEPADINTERSSLVLHLMIEGKEALQFNNLSITNSNTVAVISSWHSKNINKARGTSDIEAGRKLFKQLCENWPALKSYFGKNTPSIELIEDYGMGSILLATSQNENVYTWHVNIAT